MTEHRSTDAAVPLPRHDERRHDTHRRTLLKAGGLALLLGSHEIASGASIVAVRVWPAEDYTRVTIETDTKLQSEQLVVGNPPRLAVDIHGLDLNPALRDLVGKIRPGDPYIAGLRVGQNAPGVVRIVFDLKQPVLPQVFSLTPVAAYKHRLVLDLYPQQPVDPMEQLIASRLRDTASTEVSDAARVTTPLTEVPRPAVVVGQLKDKLGDPLGDLMVQSARSAGPSRVETAPPPPTEIAAAPAAPKPRTPVASKHPRGASASRTDRLIIVALDPGHGGEDPGASGPSGTREKDIVLQVAYKLRDRINAATVNGNPMRAFMTRDADFFVPLYTRVDKARRVQADLFISIHADAFSNPDANGASVFALSQNGASSSAARWMANKENEADKIGGVNVASGDRHLNQALLDMSTTAQINDSMRLGSAMLGEIRGIGARLHKPRVEQAGFAVLKAPDIPSVLVETAFISNPEEERRLRSSAYQNDLAEALMKGIQRYFAQNPPLARSRQL